LIPSAIGPDRAISARAEKEDPMPLYIDFHAKMPPLPPGALDEMKKELGKTDKEGAKLVNAFFTADGQGYCISEAPNADVVCKSHAAKGFELAKGEVHEIKNTLA
jgi:hypothetical protein